MVIKLSNRTKSLGRNGTMHMDGLSIERSGLHKVRLSPVNSKGMVGRSYIEIPDKDIDTVIKALKSYKEGAWT